MVNNIYNVTNAEEAKRFNDILRAFWTDNSIEENAETILQFYLRTNNYQFIDTKNNNQIAFFIGFTAKNEELINLLTYSNLLKNKNYSIKDISNFYASEEGLENILLNILDNLNSDNCAFDKSSRKAITMFKQSCSDYFVYNLENEYGDPVATKNNLLKFIKIAKVKLEDNQYNIITRLLENEQASIFLEIYEKVKNKDSFIDKVHQSLNSEHSAELSEEAKKTFDSIYLKHTLNNNLGKKETKKSNKI